MRITNILRPFKRSQAPSIPRISANSLQGQEAQLGGQLFGPIPDGQNRQFYCQDPSTWVWREEWVDQNGQAQTLVTRYQMRSGVITKQQTGQADQIVDIDEARNLLLSVRWYYYLIRKQLYQTV